MQGLLVILFIIVVIVLFLLRKKPPAVISNPLPANYKEILNTQVRFYTKLSDDNKLVFEEKVKDFLSYVHIHGVNTTIDDTHRLLVAASAIIPIFGFKDWKYYNLTDVLIYDDLFNAEDFKTTGEGRNVGGMVGTGAMNNVMILSKHELEQGYANKTDKHNTGVHEFVHLLDKSDGATDGIPENLLDKKEIAPWIKLIHQNIQAILKNKSDINPYGATNEAEFFAVVSEYFFERPELLAEKHPELFTLLEEIFNPQQAGNNTSG